MKFHGSFLRTHSLKWKLLTPLVGLVLMSLILISVRNYNKKISESIEQSFEQVQEKLNITVFSLENSDRINIVQRTLTAIGATRDILAVGLVRKSDGKILGANHASQNGQPISVIFSEYPEFERIISQSDAGSDVCEFVESSGRIACARKIFLSTNLLLDQVHEDDGLVLYLASSTSHYQQDARHEFIQELTIIFLVILMTLVAYYFQINQLILSRIFKLKKFSIDWAQGDRTKIEIASQGDEIVELTKGFNSLIEALSKSEKLIQDQQVKLVHSAQYKALGEMAAGVAHEINNPLAIISTRLQLLKRKIEKATSILPEEKTPWMKDIDLVNETTVRMKKIIDGLTRFSRTSENDEFQSYPVLKLLEDSAALCFEKMKNKGIELKIDCQLPEGFAISCRPVQMSQVMINLLNNAYDALLDATGPKTIIVKSFNENSNLCIEVKDTGPGIDAKIIDKVMLPFFTTKPVGKGTGIGLSISKGIVEDHQGQLEVESSPDGALFRIRIPQKLGQNQVA